MQFVKRFSRGFLATVFNLCLIGLVVLGPIVMVFGTSQQIEESLSDSGIYDNAVKAVVENAAKDSAGQPDSPFNQPAVQEAAQKALSPDFLQNTSEGILDGLYGWLQKKTPEPQFNIDVAAAKQQFVAAVSDYAVARASQLPACTPAQAKQLGGDVDPLTAQCLPAGYDVQSLPARIAAELEKQQGQEGNLLQQTAITPETLPKDEEGKTPVQNFTEDAKNVPEIYGWLTKGPWLLGIFALLAGGLVVFLSDDKRRALRGLGITLLVVGALTLIGIAISGYAFGKLEQSDVLANVDANLKEPVTNLVKSLRNAFNQRLMVFGLVYIVLGGGTLIALHFTKPKRDGGSSSVADKLEKPSAEEPTEKTKPNEKSQKGSPN